MNPLRFGAPDVLNGFCIAKGDLEPRLRQDRHLLSIHCTGQRLDHRYAALVSSPNSRSVQMLGL